MVIANFTNDSNPVAHGATQWNYGEMLRIQGLKLPKAVEIHFSLDRTCGQSVTRIGVTKDGVTDVVIPDSLLENEGALQEYFIYAWIYLTNATSGRTEHKLKIKVEARSKPEIPGGDDNADPFREAVKAVRESAERAETAEQQSAKHAEQTKLDAIKTGEDRTAIEEMVDSVSGIHEQVETVKGYAKQAQTAATNALLSERASEQAKESAIQAQANAETATNEAEQHALEVAGDKAEVERLATQVIQDKASVEQTKMAVDKTAQDFTLTAQQAVADVNNAGQSQTERVQTAGTTAVENIKTAQGTATGAVETKKTEAINVIQVEGATQVGNVTAEGEKQVQAVQNVAQEIIADREQIQTNKTDIAELRQGKADAIVESANGTLLNIKDSANAYFEDFSMFGKMEQMQTTGAQILNCYKLAELEPKYYFVEQGKLKVMNANDSAWTAVPEYGTLTAGTYTISGSSIEVRKAADNTLIASCIGGNFAKFTLSEDTSIKIKVGYGLNIYPCVIDAMLNKGDKPLSYELYTEGKSSPSPEYKQEIVGTGGNGQIEVQVTGKNLYDTNLEKKGFITSSGYIEENNIQNNEKKGEYIKINQYESICATVNVTIPNTEGAKPWVGIAFYDKDKNFIVRKDLYAKVLQVTIPQNAFYMIGTYRKYADGVLQIEYGNVATEYEQYKEPQTISLQLDKPMTKWDKIEKRDGVWGIARQSEIKMLDGTENWYHYTGFKNDTLRCYCVDSIKSENGFQKSLCSHFKNINNVWFDEVGKYGYYSDHNDLHNKYFISDKQSVADFKAWLAQQKEAGTPVELVYKTQTETWEPLPEETQLALNALHTNYPTTVVSNSEDAEMRLNYVADTKNYYLNREQAIRKQILEIQNALISQKISGGGSIKVTDSTELPIKGLRVFGKSEQITTNGINLIDEKDHIRSNGWFSIDITTMVQPNKQYFAKATIKNATMVKDESIQIRIDCIKNGETKYIFGTYAIDGEIKVSFNLDTFDKVKIQFKAKEMQNGVVDITNIMVSEKDVPYEPYTGGKPSPSTEYPQEITSAGESGTISLEITGENAEPQSLAIPTPNGLRGLKVDFGGNYTDANGQQWITDRIIEKDGIWGIERNVCSAILDGETNNVKNVSKPDWANLINCSLWDCHFELAHAEGGMRGNSLSNSLQYNYANADEEHYYVTDRKENFISLFILDSRLKNVDAKTANEWCKQNKPVFLYQLASPIFEPLSKAKQDVLRQLHTNYPTTIITNDANADMELEYTVDTQSYIDSKIAEISKAIL